MHIEQYEFLEGGQVVTDAVGKKAAIYSLHAEISQTLSNPKRLEIIDALREGEKSVSELESVLGISQSNLSQHLGILRERAVVVGRREGPNIFYKISSPKIFEASDILRDVLLERLEEQQELTREMMKRR